MAKPTIKCGRCLVDIDLKTGKCPKCGNQSFTGKVEQTDSCIKIVAKNGEGRIKLR